MANKIVGFIQQNPNTVASQ